jgi:Skp family chaperone for outer membrane proteins
MLRLLLALLIALPLAAADGPAPRVAVLRLDNVFAASVIYKAAVEAAKKDSASAKERLEQIEEAMKAAETKLKAVGSGSEQAQRFADDLEQLRLQRKQFLERARGDLERRQITAIREVFKRIKAELAEYSRSRGIAYVGLAQDADLGGPMMDQLPIHVQLGLQSTLYYDPSLDVTDDFIVFFNARTESLVGPSATAAK